MSLPSFMKPKKSLEELEEEEQLIDAEISLLQKQNMRKELRKRGIELDSFKDNGIVDWRRIKNWLKTHG